MILITKSVQKLSQKWYNSQSTINVFLRLPFFMPMGGQSEQHVSFFPIKMGRLFCKMLAFVKQ